MSKRVKHIFILIYVFSLFSLTLQSSIINSGKISKAFKSQQNPITEEEGNDSDESADEEVFNLDGHSFSYISQNFLKFSWATLKINFHSSAKTILVRPPKH